MPVPYARPLIGKQPFRHQVWLCGRWDEAELLSVIVGWAVGSFSAVEHAAGVADLERRGLISTRRHAAPAGEWDCYRLTNAGFVRLAEIGYGNLHDRAVRVHRWYARQGCMGRPDPDARDAAGIEIPEVGDK